MGSVPISKVAVTSEGPTLSDAVDPRFGRAGGFVVVDLITLATTYVDNGSSQVLAQGAGIQAAENLVKAGSRAMWAPRLSPPSRPRASRWSRVWKP